MPVIPVCLRAGSRRDEKDSQRQDGQQALYHVDNSLVEELEVEGKQYVLIRLNHEMNGRLNFVSVRVGSENGLEPVQNLRRRGPVIVLAADWAEA